jgi:hypothetical protein
MPSDTGKQRFIPTSQTVLQAAESLPPADSWRAEHYHVPVGERLIEFRKVKMKSRNGNTHHWVYDGKMLV